jgi:hypothetical protein
MLDPDVVAGLKEYAHRRRSSFKAALNTLVRRGLAAPEPRASTPPFVVEPHAGGFKPGLDLAKLNPLADQLETDDFVREARMDGTRSPRLRRKAGTHHFSG